MVTFFNRLLLNTVNFKHLASLLSVLLDEDIPRDDIFVEAFRFLRNSVVACARNQNSVREESNLYEVTKCFLQTVYCQRELALDAEKFGEMTESKCSEARLVAIRCSLQFLANCMVDNQTNVEKVASMHMMNDL